MIFILEAVGVGVYSVLLFIVFSSILTKFNTNTYVALLLIGFFKHFLGYYVGLQTWYCNNGGSCVSLHKKQETLTTKYVGIPTNLIYNSIIEAFFYLFIGAILYWILLYSLNKTLLVYINFILYFLLGFILHIMANKLGIHKSFCINNCIPLANYRMQQNR